MSVHARFRERILANAKEAENNARVTDDQDIKLDYLLGRERYEMMLAQVDHLPVSMPDQIELLKKDLALRTEERVNPTSLCALAIAVLLFLAAAEHHHKSESEKETVYAQTTH